MRGPVIIFWGACIFLLYMLLRKFKIWGGGGGMAPPRSMDPPLLMLHLTWFEEIVPSSVKCIINFSTMLCILGNNALQKDGYLCIDVHEIYTIKYSYIYIFSLTFMLFCDWLYIIFVSQVTMTLLAKWG